MAISTLPNVDLATVLQQALAAPLSHLSWFCSWFLRFSTLILDGRNRIGLVGQQGAGDLQAPPHTSLQVLFRDDAKRLEVRRILHEAFGSYFVIDPTALGHLRIRFSSRAPASLLEERGIHDDAVRFHAAAQSIDTASDGVLQVPLFRGVRVRGVCVSYTDVDLIETIS